MSKILRALLISAGATAVAALLLRALDLDGASPSDAFGEEGFPGPNPDELSDEDIDAMMNELANQLNF